MAGGGQMSYMFAAADAAASVPRIAAEVHCYVSVCVECWWCRRSLFDVRRGAARNSVSFPPWLTGSRDPRDHVTRRRWRVRYDASSSSSRCRAVINAPLTRAAVTAHPRVVSHPSSSSESQIRIRPITLPRQYQIWWQPPYIWQWPSFARLFTGC